MVSIKPEHSSERLKMKTFCVVVLVAAAVCSIRCDEKPIAKRSTLLDTSAWDFGSFVDASFPEPWSNRVWPSAETKAAVAAAKAAADGVRRAQHEFEAARAEALHQQKRAAAKNLERARARSEAVVAANEAARAAATATSAGARVVAAQREAAHREALAASALQAIAAHAAVHISNADVESAKLAAIQSSEAAASASKGPFVKPFYQPLHTVALPVHWN